MTTPASAEITTFTSPPPLEHPAPTNTDLSILYPPLPPTGLTHLPPGSLVHPDFIVITDKNADIKAQLQQLKQRKQLKKQQLQSQPAAAPLSSLTDVIDLTDAPHIDQPLHQQHTEVTTQLFDKPAAASNFHTSTTADEFMSIAEYAAPKPLITAPAPPSQSHTKRRHTGHTNLWLSSHTQHSPTLRLHEEILDFCSYVSPTPAEHHIRVQLIDRLTTLVHATLNDKVQVKTFGSFATRLYLPISDIDVCLLGVKQQGFYNVLETLATAIKNSNTASFIEVISKARIPIIKLTDKQTGIKIDISVDVQGGIDAAAYLNERLTQYPAMRPLILFLKYFLHCRALNETYTGGIGSFVLQMMVLSFVQLHVQKFNHKCDASQLSLGILLMSFFDLYGRQLNYYTTGIDVNTASYYNKHAMGRYNGERPYLLSIQNPLDAAHDISANSYQILKIRRAFYYAYMRLLSVLHRHTSSTGNGVSDKQHSMLAAVLSIDPEMQEKRDKLDLKAMSDGFEVDSDVHDRPNKRVKLGDPADVISLLDDSRNGVIEHKHVNGNASKHDPITIDDSIDSVDDDSDSESSADFSDDSSESYQPSLSPRSQPTPSPTHTDDASTTEDMPILPKVPKPKTTKTSTKGTAGLPPWTNEQREQTLQLHDQGKSKQEISLAVGRHVKSVHKWLKKVRPNRVIRKARLQSQLARAAQDALAEQSDFVTLNSSDTVKSASSSPSAAGTKKGKGKPKRKPSMDSAFSHGSGNNGKKSPNSQVRKSKTKIKRNSTAQRKAKRRAALQNGKK